MFSIKVVDVVPLKKCVLLVFFEDGKVKKFDTKKLRKDWPEFNKLTDDSLFYSVKVEPGGYGVSWNDELDCSEGELYENGVNVSLDLDDFQSFVQNNLISTKEASVILNCSKQNIDDLVKRGKLHPIKIDNRYSLFSRAEVQKRTWIYEINNSEGLSLVAEEPVGHKDTGGNRNV